VTWFGAQIATALARVSQPCCTQYWRGPGSDSTRARPGCTSITVVPMAPVTSYLRATFSASSVTSCPSRLTMARSATPPRHSSG
jgi:hypothetical protein